jgi:glycosyltransferase involved in cell wall biosynthesis
MHCQVVNLQTHLGGAEVYTLFFTRALLDLGCEVTLHAHPDATHWDTLAHARLRIERVSGSDALIAKLPPERQWIVTHAPVSPGFAAQARQQHLLTGFCHMPLAGRRAGVLADYHRVFGVSGYVLATARDAGLDNLDPEPCYGMVDFERYSDAGGGPILPGILYTWDQRKFRDRIYGLTESALAPLRRALSTPRPFVRRKGLALGLVSGIGPIKQFDLLFTHLAPIIAAQPDVSLEIFGWGGYRSVTDLRIALRPLGGRARFWGRQVHPEQVYPHLDYLMSGLPEKEALGLNILEAQALGTPVLAVDAPPFTETMIDGATGFLYRDPRQDGGADFGRVLARTLAGPRPDPCDAQEHLARFSRAAFTARVGRMVQEARAAL